MSLIEYINKNWTDKRFDAAFSINGYNNRLSAIINPDLKKVLNSKRLSREIVYEWVGLDSYKGFLAAMLWGGISAATSKKKVQSNAELAFSYDKAVIESILVEIKSILTDGKEGEAFDYLFAGAGKIKGIGVSYLTKILYFFSERGAKESLIFDRWGHFIHAALLIEDDKVHVEDYYQYKSKEDFKAELISKKSEKELYLDYLTRMRGIKNDKIASPGHLEAFLFGDKLYKKNQNNDNPRYFIYNLVKCYFSNSTPQTI